MKKCNSSDGLEASDEKKDLAEWNDVTSDDLSSAVCLTPPALAETETGSAFGRRKTSARLAPPDAEAIPFPPAPKRSHHKRRLPDSYSADEIAAMVAPWAGDLLPLGAVPYLWPGWIPRGMTTLLAGDPGTGKTSLAFAWAVIVAGGLPWPGETSGHAPASVVIYSNEERDRKILGNHLHAAARLALPNADDAALQEIEARVTVIPLRTDGGDEVSPASMPDLFRSVLCALRPSLVIIDNGTAILPDGVSLNDWMGVRAAFSVYDDWALESGAAILALMHTSKNTDARSSADKISGSRASACLARSIISVEKNFSADDSGAPRFLAAVSKASYARARGGLAYDTASVPLIDRDGASFASYGVSAAHLVEGDPDRLLRACSAPPLSAEDKDLETIVRNAITDSALPGECGGVRALSGDISKALDVAGYTARSRPVRRVLRQLAEPGHDVDSSGARRDYWRLRDAVRRQAPET